MATLDRTQRKGVRNEMLIRSINERIVDLTAAADGYSIEPLALLCECYDEYCLETLELTLTEYETLRSSARCFPVKPGHVLAEIERVVDATERYAVVEKRGDAGRIAADRASGTRAEGDRRGSRHPQAAARRRREELVGRSFEAGGSARPR